MPLITLQQAKDLLGITHTRHDTQINALITPIEHLMNDWCSRKLEETTHTEYQSGDATEKLLLRHFPLSAIAGVWVDNSGAYGYGPDPFASATALTQGIDYVPSKERHTVIGSGSWICQDGVLLHLKGGWPRCPHKFSLRDDALASEAGAYWGNIKVTYTAGFTSSNLPQQLRLAEAWAIAAAMRTGRFGDAVFVGEKLGEWEYKLQALVAGVPEFVSLRQMCARLKETLL